MGMNENQREKLDIINLKDYVVVDVETTGFSKVSDEILQIAMIKVRNNEIVDSFNFYVKPLFHKKWSRAEEVNHITYEMVENAPFWTELRPKALEFIGNDIIVGHNIGFDLKFIDSWFEEYEYIYTQEDLDYIRSRAEAPVTPGVLSERTKQRHIKELEYLYVGYKEMRYGYHRGGDLGIQINNMHIWYDYVDVLAMAKTKQFTSCALESLVEELHLEVEGSMHNALTDVIMTKKLFDVLKVDFRDVKSVRKAEFKNKLSELNENRIEADNILSGKTVVVTGTLSMVRIDFLSMLSKFGVIVGNSVTKKTDYLIVGENVGQTKIDKAIKYGVKVITETEVLSMLKQ